MLTRSELLRKRIDRFSRLLNGLEKGDPVALHRTRVASRHLRELLPVLQLSGGAVRKHRKRIRAVTVQLGLVRELDVAVHLVAELHESRHARSGALTRLSTTISRKRDQARKRMRERLPIARLTRTVRKLTRLADELEAAERGEEKVAQRRWRWAVDARIASRANALGDAIAEAGAVYLPERLHDVRIALKKLRYAVEIAADANGGEAAAAVRTLRRVQDILGRMHDLEVLIERVRRAQARLTPPNLQTWRDLDDLIGTLESDCRRQHAHYMRHRDVLLDFVERFGARQRGQSTRRAG